MVQSNENIIGRQTWFPKCFGKELEIFENVPIAVGYNCCYKINIYSVQIQRKLEFRVDDVNDYLSFITTTFPIQQ
jgi:hypothetical protein